MTENLPAVEQPKNKMNLSSIVPSGGRGGGVTFLPRTMQECLDFATVMSKSDFAIPPKFRGNPGACLAITIQACRWEADPFGVIQKAYITKSKDGSERLAYEAQLVAAVVNTRAPLVGRLKLIYSGVGGTRKLKVIGTFTDDPEPKELETPEIGKIKIKNSPLWESDPDQQLAYYGQRAWGRRWCPEVLLGIYTPEEIEQAPIMADAVRPTRQIAAEIDRRGGGPVEIVEEGIVVRQEEERPVESQDVIAQADALKPREEEVLVDNSAQPITTGEAQRMDEMIVDDDQEVEAGAREAAAAHGISGDGLSAGDDAVQAKVREYEDFVGRSIRALDEPDMMTEADFDEFAQRTKDTLKHAGIPEDDRDDLRGRFVGAFLEKKRKKFGGGRR